MNLTTRFKILDGGLATELENRGHDLNHELWSARMLVENPAEILAVHRTFLDAGADVITSASYQATIAGFESVGLSKAEAERCIVRSVELARQACNEHSLTGSSRSVVVASVGPFGAAQADGSEYTGNYDLDESELIDFHDQRWRLLCSTGPDQIICETIPKFSEARALAQLSSTTDVPVWISFSCRNESEISDGTDVKEVARFVAASSVKGIGINCTPPNLILPLVSRIRQTAPDIPIMIYPNSGETYLSDSRTWQGERDPNELATFAKRWLELSVQVIGGCCRTTPGHIRKLKELRDAPI